MAWLMATVAWSATDFNESEYTFPDGSKMLVPAEAVQPDDVPVGTIVHNERGPENLVNLPPDRVTTVVSVNVGNGVWQ